MTAGLNAPCDELIGKPASLNGRGEGPPGSHARGSIIRDLCASHDVLAALGDGELSQAEVAAATGRSQGAESRRLASLTRGGWAECLRRHPRRHYRLTRRGREAYTALEALAGLAPEVGRAEAMQVVRLLASGERLRLADVLRGGDASTSRLAAASGLLPVNASKALGFMESAGVVGRARSRRAVVNTLTERGRRLLEILDEFTATGAAKSASNHESPDSPRGWGSLVGPQPDEPLFQ